MQGKYAYRHPFLTSLLQGVQRLASRPGSFTPGKKVHQSHQDADVDALGTQENVLHQRRLELRNVQPVISLLHVPTELSHKSLHTDINTTHQSSFAWFVPKVSVLIFYLNVYWTHLKLQVISFKACPLGSYTMVPTFFPLIIAVLEVIFRKCV